MAVFQPHLYSRTRDFAAEFASSLSLADKVVLLDIYPARERPIEGVTSKLILESLPLSKDKAIHLEGNENLDTRILREVAGGDIVIAMGAGSITNHIDKLIREHGV